MDKKNPLKGQTIETGTYATTIRISDDLANRIKERSYKTGASINSTMCHLLDLGLKVDECRTIVLQE